MKKLLYGLKQDQNVWNKRIDGFLKEVGFKKCVSEHGIYVTTDTSERVVILCLYVDGLLIMGSNGKCISKFKSEIMKEFETTDLSLMTYFLGIEFYKSKSGLLMHQRRHVFKILKKFEIEHCNAAITPVEMRLQLVKNEDEQDVYPTQYRRLIGSLCYLCYT